ncbi:MAG: hypothetical protein HETSPECPRED_008964 [Heterodermia speciosa]|uniref:Urea transporter n=1 Tax=Heterodermia speciosa TaxID=116794 RepID=A0A8H3ENT9_9LECA|nr:MAG: hypothetical protein HETSPECPRED_008964 [Heterodermia speciosa]
MVLGLVVLAAIAVGVETHVDRTLIESSGFLSSSLLGWQLIYILPLAILTNDFFISGFWMRTFASKTDKDLIIGTAVATVAVTCILTLVGATGLLAAWTGAWPGDPPQEGSIALFLLLGQLPAWVIGIVLVMTVSLSTAALDSLQSAMVSTGSNDLFRNKLHMGWIRLIVLLVIVPAVVVALKSPDILQIYLISDLVSASSIPVLVIGLNDRFYWWRGFEVVVGGLGGLLTVFVFGTIYYGNAQDGANLMLLENGLYAEDWSAFGGAHRTMYAIERCTDISPGAFVAAPIGGLLCGFGSFALRIACLWIAAKVKGHRFEAFDRPRPLEAADYVRRRNVSEEDQQHMDNDEASSLKGKFF